MKRTFPVYMVSPFEGSHHVAGGVLLPEIGNDGFLFLEFSPGTTDLVMHSHDHSHRLIYVLDGRGFFHVTAEPREECTGERVRHVPVRSRDVLLFSRGTVHTFSTGSEPLVVLSYHAPFIELEDERQYTVPEPRIFPGRLMDQTQSVITCDPAWSRLV